MNIMQFTLLGVISYVLTTSLTTGFLTVMLPALSLDMNHSDWNAGMSVLLLAHIIMSAQNKYLIFNTWLVKCSRKTELGYVTITEDGGRITGLTFDDSGDVKSNHTLDDAFLQLEQYFSGERKEFDLRYSFQGTEFQKETWNALLRIPYGKVISYREEAEMIGRPDSFRAVGNANGKNPIAIFVPCHRVIKSDGTLGGYSSGLNIKRILLRLEGAEWTAGKSF